MSHSNPSGPLQNSSILLVDPDESASAELASQLRHEGATVSIANDGPSAWDAIRAQRPKVVVAELMLPGLSGVELLLRLRDVPAAPTTIVLTANPTARLKAYCTELGAADYFVKPASTASLASSIAAHCDR